MQQWPLFLCMGDSIHLGVLYTDVYVHICVRVCVTNSSESQSDDVIKHVKKKQTHTMNKHRAQMSIKFQKSVLNMCQGHSCTISREVETCFLPENDLNLQLEEAQVLLCYMLRDVVPLMCPQAALGCLPCQSCLLQIQRNLARLMPISIQPGPSHCEVLITNCNCKLIVFCMQHPVLYLSIRIH